MIERPIGILDEHPEWSRRLTAALDARRLPYEKIDHSSHAYDPRDRDPHYAVLVNHREQILKVLDRIAFPLVVKPNVGGSGAGIVRFDSLDALRAGLDALAF